MAHTPRSSRQTHRLIPTLACATAVGLLVLLGMSPGGASIPSAHAATGQTTYSAQTTNNTAACSAAGYGLSGTGYCSGTFQGFTDKSSPAGSSTQPLTQPHDPQVSGTWNISKGHGTQAGDVHSLLYAGATTKILAETQLWFCYGTSTGSNQTVVVDGQTLYRNQTCPFDGQTTRSGYSNHMVIGYDSNNQDKANATADDMYDRGFDGIVADWSGDPNTCNSGPHPYVNNSPMNAPCNSAAVSTVDQATKKLDSAMDTRHSGMTHLVMYDDSAYKFTQCDAADSYQPQCVQNKMLADFNVLISSWFTDSGYQKIGSQPVLAFFLSEGRFSQCGTTYATCHLTGSYTCTSQTSCWNSLWDGIRSNFQNHGVNPYLIFESNESHYQGDGAFAWVEPSGGSTQTTASVQDNWGTKSYLDNELHVGSSALSAKALGANGQAKTFFAGAWKGFDDRMANWSPSWNQSTGQPVPAPVASPNYPRTTSQRCGNNWIDTFAEASATDPSTGKPYFSTSNQLPLLMAGTWDDYEEGTQIETGISNCVSSLNASLSGNSLNWTIAFSGEGSERTVDHYTVYYSTDGTAGQQLNALTTVAVDTSKGGSYSLDLTGYASALPNPTVLYVQATGKPSITNHTSTGVTYTGGGGSGGALTGKVTDLNSGAAISGATVSYSGSASASTTTDANGNYTFTGVPAGTYSVSGVASGYPSRTYSGVAITTGQTTTQNLQLTTTGRVTGTVTGAGGVALSGATVKLQGGNLPTTDTVTTNTSGQYTSNWDPIGTYTVTCSASGYASQTVSGVSITTGGLTTVNCSLSNTGTLTGKVTNLQNGAALSGATVTYSGSSTSVTTDTNGNYTFTNVTAGTYSVTGKATGYLTRTYTGVTVTAGQTTTQNLQLSTSGKIGGTVTNASGAAISGATITISGGDIQTTDVQTSSSNGSYLSNWDPVGTYTVTCQASGYSTVTHSGVTITAGNTTTVNCQM